jgi:Domain of unknown function (DUF5655)
MTSQALWTCPECRRTFANRNQTHFCGSTTSLDAHFERRDPRVRALFDRFVAHVRALGPVEILPEKTRIAFHVRMSFAVLSPRKDGLVGHFVLARRVEHPRFTRVETYSARNHLHAFRIVDERDFDEEFLAFLAEAYAVGEQKHVERRRPAG